MNVGDLVKEELYAGADSPDPKTREVRIGVITGVRDNGDCYVHYPCGLMLINQQWLEVINA